MNLIKLIDKLESELEIKSKDSSKQLSGVTSVVSVIEKQESSGK